MNGQTSLRALVTAVVVVVILGIATAVAYGDYTVPPTNNGALGVSAATWTNARDAAGYVSAGAAIVAAYAGGIAAGAAVPTLGVSVPTAGAVAVAAGVVAGGAAGLAVLFNRLAGDPPDHHFKQIFKPILANIPSLGLAARYAAVNTALHRLLLNELRINEYATAYMTAINRITGAKLAHAAIWVTRQRHAAAKYARLAGNLLIGLEKNRDELAAALEHDGVTFTLTAQQSATAKSLAVGKALPVSETRVLKDLTLGSVSAELKQAILNTAPLKREIANAHPGAVNFAGGLAAPKLAVREAEVGGALLGYAIAYG